MFSLVPIFNYYICSVRIVKFGIISFA